MQLNPAVLKKETNFMKNILTALLLVTCPGIALAHGENTPGPHNGAIQMPGAFHTELLLNKDQSVRIYLLDIHFQNPTTKDSSVAVSFKDKKNTTDFKCSAVGDYFECSPFKPYGTVGELIVKADRQKSPSTPAIYKLPLKGH